MNGHAILDILASLVYGEGVEAAFTQKAAGPSRRVSDCPSPSASAPEQRQETTPFPGADGDRRQHIRRRRIT